MSTIKGKWVFKDEIAEPQEVSQNVSFTSNNIQYSVISVVLTRFGDPLLRYDNITVFDLTGFELGYAGWLNEAYRTVDFGTTDQTVSDTFLTWMQANATQQAEPIPTDKVSVYYKGELLGTIEQNNEGIIGCTGETMEDDIIIRVPAMGGAVETISFKLDGNTREAVSGMNWGEWVYSSYASPNGYVTAGNVYIADNVQVTNVLPRTVITPNGTYFTPHTGGGGSN